MDERNDIWMVGKAFMRSRIILTAAELDLFTFIDESPSNAETIAAKSGLDKRALERVLDCLVTFGLLSKENSTYLLTAEGAPFSSRNPSSELPMLLHMSRLWLSWSNLSDVVRNGPGRANSAGPMDPDSRRAFIGAMHVIGRGLSEEIAGSLDLSGYGKLLDIGGGSGTYTIAFLKRNPQLKAILFDLKDVVPMAGERIAAEGFH